MENKFGLEGTKVRMVKGEHEGKTGIIIEETGYTDGYGVVCKIKLEDGTEVEYSADFWEEDKEEVQEEVQELEFEIETKKLMAFVRAVYCLTEEARIGINRDGWRVVVTDSGHVSLVDYRIPVNEFVKYTEGEREIAIDFDRVFSFLNKVNGEFAIISINRDSMYITIDGITRGFALLDVEDYQKMDIPELGYTAKIVLANTEKLCRILDIADTIADYIIIETQDGKCTIKAESDMNERMKANIDGEITGEAISKYPLDHITPIMKIVRHIQKTYEEPIITIEYKTEHPIKISTQNCYYLVAPRVF